jgi:tetratricopeptide (TPR) repeat protein
LIPPITLNLLIVKGEPESVFSFGEKHYKEYLEMAAPLSAFYLKSNLRDKAIAMAEKALEILQGKSRDLRFGFPLSDPLKELREFLDGCYSLESDYPKILENLIMLVSHERDIAYYRKLKRIIKTEQEKNAIIERLEKLLDSDYDLLFKIYSIEDDYERMLKLAKKSARFDVFNLIVKKIRDRYPEECFELYKKKINTFVEDVKKRDAYRQAAYWLKLMKEIPGTQDKFRKYIEHLREKYRRRPAFIDETKGI